MNDQKKIEHKGFHITITSLTNGNVLFDKDSNCIVAGINTSEGSSVMVASECNAKDLIKCILSSEQATKEAKKSISGKEIFAFLAAELANEVEKKDDKKQQEDR